MHRSGFRVCLHRYAETSNQLLSEVSQVIASARTCCQLTSRRADKLLLSLFIALKSLKLKANSLSTRQLVYLSTRQLVNLSTRQLVHHLCPPNELPPPRLLPNELPPLRLLPNELPLLRLPPKELLLRRLPPNELLPDEVLGELLLLPPKELLRRLPPNELLPEELPNELLPLLLPKELLRRLPPKVLFDDEEGRRPKEEPVLSLEEEPPVEVLGEKVLRGTLVIEPER